MFLGVIASSALPLSSRESCPQGMFTACPSQQVLNLSDESLIAKFLLLALSAARSPSAAGALSCAGSGTFILCWLSPAPSLSLWPWKWETPGTEPQQGLGQIWVGPAWYLPNLPCFLLAAAEFLLSSRGKPSLADQPSQTGNTECWAHWAQQSWDIYVWENFP